MSEQTSTIEEWRPVDEEWGDRYHVSSFGRVRSHCVGTGSRGDGYIITGSLDKDGYRRLALYRAPMRAYHRVASLVAAAFHGPRPSGHVVRHIDGSTTNDRADNLEWGTQAQNLDDKRRHGTHPSGERNARASMTDATAQEILNRHRGGERPSALAVEYGLTKPTVYQLCSRKSWKHLV